METKQFDDDGLLKVGTIRCPFDDTKLHFELIGGSMRVRRKKQGVDVYQARCPHCGSNLDVRAAPLG